MKGSFELAAGWISPVILVTALAMLAADCGGGSNSSSRNTPVGPSSSATIYDGTWTGTLASFGTALASTQAACDIFLTVTTVGVSIRVLDGNETGGTITFNTSLGGFLTTPPCQVGGQTWTYSLGSGQGFPPPFSGEYVVPSAAGQPVAATLFLWELDPATGGPASAVIPPVNGTLLANIQLVGVGPPVWSIAQPITLGLSH